MSQLNVRDVRAFATWVLHTAPLIEAPWWVTAAACLVILSLDLTEPDDDDGRT